LIAVLVSD